MAVKAKTAAVHSNRARVPSWVAQSRRDSQHGPSETSVNGLLHRLCAQKNLR